MLLVGIEPPRVLGVELAEQVLRGMHEAEQFKLNWRDHCTTWQEAKSVYRNLQEEAAALMPPLKEERLLS